MFRDLACPFFLSLFLLSAPLSSSALPLIDIYSGSTSCRSIVEAALSTEELTFRFANSGDHAELQKLINEVRKEFIKDYEFLEGTFDHDLMFIDETYDRESSRLYIIEDKNGKILGSGGFFRTSKDSVELRKFYFSKEIRGRRLGGPWLDYLIEQAFNTGVNRIWLVNHHELPDATNLYRRRHFKLYSPDQNEFSVPMDRYHYFQLFREQLRLIDSLQRTKPQK